MNIPTDIAVEGGVVLIGFAFGGWNMYLTSVKRSMQGDIRALKSGFAALEKDQADKWIVATRDFVAKAEMEAHFTRLEQKVDALTNLLLQMIRNAKTE